MTMKVTIQCTAHPPVKLTGHVYWWIQYCEY